LQLVLLTLLRSARVALVVLLLSVQMVLIQFFIPLLRQVAVLVVRANVTHQQQAVRVVAVHQTA
jgi:hypothetical protein